MDNIHIKAEERSPEIAFDFAANTYVMRGESYPEDVNAFFGPVLSKLEAHFDELTDAEVKFTFELIYFNSSTAKILMRLFEILDELAERGNSVVVTWLYEADDDNMEELGEEFGEDLEHATFQLQKT